MNAAMGIAERLRALEEAVAELQAVARGERKKSAPLRRGGGAEGTEGGGRKAEQDLQDLQD